MAKLFICTVQNGSRTEHLKVASVIEEMNV